MAEKTLAQIAWEAMDAAWSLPAEESWQAVSDAVIAEYERRRWKEAFAALTAPPAAATETQEVEHDPA